MATTTKTAPRERTGLKKRPRSGVTIETTCECGSVFYLLPGSTRGDAIRCPWCPRRYQDKGFFLLLSAGR